MNKPIKILAITFATLALLVVIAISMLNIFVDPNDYKKDIEQAAFDKADIELKILGDIGWSLFPSIGVDITSITASYPEQNTVATLKGASVSVMMMPLLSGEVKMKAITIEGLTLDLVKGGESVDTTASTDEASKKTTEKSQTSNIDTSNNAITPGIEKFDIESISIIDATITLTDKDSGEVIRISDLNLTTDNVRTGQPFTAELNFKTDIHRNKQQIMAVTSALSGVFNIDLVKQTLLIDDFKSQFDITADKSISLTLTADIAADLKQPQIAISNLQLQSLGTTASGSLTVTGEDFSQLDGQLQIASFDAKKLLKSLGLSQVVTADDSSLRNIALSTKISGNAQAINFTELAIRIDDSQLLGSANYQLSNALVSFDLSADKINLNNYLPPSTANTQSTASNTDNKKPANTTTKSPSSSPYSKDIMIPMQPLRDLMLNGKLVIKQLNYQSTNIQNFTFNIDAKNGLIKIPKLNMGIYQGSIANNITIDARKKVLSVNIKNSINKLQIGPALNDFAQSQAISGVLTSSSNLNISGQSVHSFVNSLSGQVKVSLADGVIQGIDAAQKMCETVNSISSLGGALKTTQSVDKSTPFASINGTFNLNNGVISNKNFNADLDAINANGKGTINLAKQSLDYRLGLKIQDNLFNKSCSVNNKIQNIEWPIDCKGNFSDSPLSLCKPDLSVVKDILKNALKAKLKKELEDKLGASVKEKKQEIKQKIEEKVQDKLKGVLKGLF